MDNDLSRRGFICGALALAATGIDTALLAEGAQAANGVRVLASGKVEVTVAKVPALAKVGGVALVGNVQGVPVALVRSSAKSFEALNLICRHQGATVELNGTKWVCPRHGSEYALNGALKLGPSTKPLLTLPTKVTKKTVTIG